VALDADDVSALTAFVHAGGVLVVGPLAGHRDTRLQGPWHAEPPGALAALTGTANAETTTLAEPARIRCRRSGCVVDATRYAEILEARAPEAEVLAEHALGWFAGSPAVVGRPLGAGLVIHCGVGSSDAVIEWLWQSQIAPRLASARRVRAAESVRLSSDAAEVLTRSNRELALHFLLNHGAATVTCELASTARDLLTEELVPTSFELPGYSYRILRERLTETASGA